MRTTVREMKESDIDFIVDYFVTATPEFMLGMGAGPSKIPGKEKWSEILQKEFKNKAVLCWL